MSHPMGLRIPDRQKPALQELAGLPDSELEALISALQSARPKARPGQLATDLVSRWTALSPESLSNLLATLASLYLTAHRYGIPIERLSHDVAESAAKEEVLKQSGIAAEAFAARLNRLLSLHVSLGVTAKAVDVLVQHQRPFKAARIMTDLRPVFSEDDSTSKVAGFVVHSLKIESTSGESVFFALDSSDLRVLGDVVQRALRKEVALIKHLGHGGIEIIEPDFEWNRT